MRGLPIYDQEKRLYFTRSKKGPGSEGCMRERAVDLARTRSKRKEARSPPPAVLGADGHPALAGATRMAAARLGVAAAAAMTEVSATAMVHSSHAAERTRCSTTLHADSSEKQIGQCCFDWMHCSRHCL
eukprot:513066-Pleurochrysis_carterae.AAC.2